MEAPGQQDGAGPAKAQPHSFMASPSIRRRASLLETPAGSAPASGAPDSGPPAIHRLQSMVHFPSLKRWGSILVAPKPQEDEFTHHVTAQPSFHLREKPPQAYLFQVTSFVIIASMLAAAVVDYLLKTGRM